MNEPGTGAVEVAPGRSPLASAGAPRARSMGTAADRRHRRDRCRPFSSTMEGADRRRSCYARSAGQAAHYRGPDRRPSPRPWPGRALGLAASLLAAAVALAITYSLARSASTRRP